ncbi:MAG: hypothetical protein SYR96_37185 [Actinomycetota bacterium]|nr:hypothetical protein [Actinomycetota bacterium]
MRKAMVDAVTVLVLQPAGLESGANGGATGTAAGTSALSGAHDLLRGYVS